MARFGVEGVDTLRLTHIMGLDPMDAALDWIGMLVSTQFI
jgi:hypothetical protein